MRLYYEHGGITVYHGDCMELMVSLPDKAFDLAIVDPPYGIGKDGQIKTTGGNGGRKAYEFKGWDSQTPGQDYFDNLNRVSQNQIIWGANYYPQYLQPSMGWILWDKGQRINQSDGELAYSSFNRALRVYTINRVQLMVEKGDIHPTAKPAKLYKWLLKNYAKPGDTILDTHGGSLSIAIACHDMGHKLTVIEQDEEYLEKAVKRLAAHQSQLSLAL